MRPKYSSRYWDSLYDSRAYGQLVELSSVLCCCPAFTQIDTEYGLPTPAFMFVEGLLWFSQAQRSGVWTYFEATPESRQFSMRNALDGNAPAEFAAHYAMGMRDWRHKQKIDHVDRWIKAHDQDNNGWLWNIADEHRSLFEQTCG